MRCEDAFSAARCLSRKRGYGGDDDVHRDDRDGGDDDDDTFSNHGGHAGSEAPLRFVAYQDLTPIRRLPPMSM